MGDEFFATPDERSLAKTKIVANYFGAWARIVLPQAKRHGLDSIAFMDLFSGPGRYQDGKASTPLWILGRAVADPNLYEHLELHFNDKDRHNSTRLEQEIAAFDGIDRLKFRPTVSNAEISTDLLPILKRAEIVPTLFFIDPWGYKGLSLDLLSSAIRGWGCDCIFFFNFNRINPAIDNEKVDELIDDLFGRERAQLLRQKLVGMSGYAREMMILNEMAEAIYSIGGKFVVPFRFSVRGSSRASHYLIFISKHFRGFHVMKDVMAGVGASSEDDSIRFEFNPAPSQLQLGLIDDFFAAQRIQELENMLLEHFRGRNMLVKDAYEEHEIARNGTSFLLRDYKTAIRNLEAVGLVYLDQPPDQRQKRGGVVTVGDMRTVFFPSG
jgi:three-Cys-motif partner protein